MSAFAIDEGGCGAGTGLYDAGVLTLSNGETRGVEDIARLTLRESAPGRRSATQAIPDFLGSLRNALPASNRLPLPTRLAVSTMRAGLGVIEDGLASRTDEPLPVEIVFSDGASLVGRVPSGLLATIRRDRDIVLGALARAGRPLAIEAGPTSDETSAESLTSIFRYEKRNGRLRRVTEPEPSAKT